MDKKTYTHAGMDDWVSIITILCCIITAVIIGFISFR